MTQKKNRPMNGGGGILSMFSSAAPGPKPEPVDILFITTHGEYADPEMVEFPSPINKIHKINVAPIGECCKLSETTAETIKSGLKQILRHPTDMETKSNSIIDLLKTIEETLKLHESAINLNPKIDNIPTVKLGDNITDKNYFVRVKELITTESPNYDTITLLSQQANPNLLKDIRGMPTRNTKEISIKLSKILHRIENYYPSITNLIIVDVTCSEVCPSRHNSAYKREEGHIFGGNYKNKSIGKLKKLKQTNNKKLRNTKTKRRKTRKMRRRLNK